MTGFLYQIVLGIGRIIKSYVTNRRQQKAQSVPASVWTPGPVAGAASHPAPSAHVSGPNLSVAHPAPSAPHVPQHEIDL